MKSLIICLLASVSSIAVADSYPYSASSPMVQLIAEDMRYTHQQADNRINQHNIDLGRQRMAQQAQYEADYEKMRQYYKDRRDTERFIGD
jgi:hypothetical protein